MSDEICQVTTRAGLLAVMRDLGVGPDWHEPDQVGVSAQVYGERFDNSGFWGGEVPDGAMGYAPSSVELHVTLSKGGNPVAEVNLATLFAWATGYEDS